MRHDVLVPVQDDGPSEGGLTFSSDEEENEVEDVEHPLVALPNHDIQVNRAEYDFFINHDIQITFSLPLGNIGLFVHTKDDVLQIMLITGLFK